MAGNLWIFSYLVCVVILPSVLAQLPDTESLRNVTACDLTTPIAVSCDADEVIAIHTLQYAYDFRCDSTCCSYNSADCFKLADDTDIRDVRRSCSGKFSCVLTSLPTNMAFCSLGIQYASYVFLQYYCIPKNRMLSICSTGTTLTSDGELLYLSNENYPSATTESDSCSCSLEAYSCETSISYYILDADLYHEISTCDQSIYLKNGTGSSLASIGCEDYYTKNISSRSIASHYTKIDFINNSTSNHSLLTSDPGVSFTLSCTAEPETWCTGCGAPQDISNGQVTLVDPTDTSYEAIATVTCSNGYETNTSTISCLGNGSWSESVCTEKAPCSADEWRCTNGDCIPDSSRCDNLPNDCPDNSDEKNCSLSPTCLEGLEACLHPNGSWVCVDKAHNCGCGPVKVIENGDINLQGNSTIGAEAEVTCNDGYDPSTQKVICLITGQWEEAKCNGVDCNTLPSVLHGNLTLTDPGNTTYGATASVVCNLGYETSASMIMCQSSGQWQSPACTIKDCNTLPSVSHGNLTLTDTGNTTYGATASVVCNLGYETSASMIMCQSSGQWQSPACTIKDCRTVPPVQNGNVVLNSGSMTTFGSSASVVCKNGYKPKKARIICQASGLWEKPLCLPEDCGHVPTVWFGNVFLTIDNTTTFESNATVTCESGYRPMKTSIECLASGQWETPECSAVDCGHVPTIWFGNVVLSNDNTTTFGSNATVTCESGYRPMKTSIECLASGQWETPECSAVDCGHVPTVWFGNVVLSNDNTTTFGSNASVTCESGYRPMNTSIECLASGQWETPECSAVGSTTPKAASAGGGKSKPDIVLIVIVVVVACVVLTQMVISIFVQCRIHRIRKTADSTTTELLKRMLWVLAGSFPLIGSIPIYYSWYKDIYHVTDETEEIEGTGQAINPTYGRTQNTASDRYNPHNGVKMNDIKLHTEHTDDGSVRESEHPDSGTEPVTNHNGLPNNVPPEDKNLDKVDEAMPPLTHENNSNLHTEHTDDGSVRESEHPVSGTEPVTNHNGLPNNVPPEDKAMPPLTHENNCSNGIQQTDVDDTGTEQSVENLKQAPTGNDTSSNYPLEAISSPVYAQNSTHEETGSKMTRGLSATFQDENDDMAIGNPNARKPLSKPKLPPIAQHPLEDYHHDSHHHHFSTQVEKTRHDLQPIADEARKQGKYVYFVREELYIDNSLYNPEHHIYTHTGNHRPKYY